MYINRLVSGSRDECFALWDLRCKSSSHKDEFCINSTGMVKGAHLSLLSKRIRRRKVLLLLILDFSSSRAEKIFSAYNLMFSGWFNKHSENAKMNRLEVFQ